MKHLGIARNVQHATLGSLSVVGQAVSLSRTPSQIRSASPEQGEHNEAILGELGLNPEDIAGLKEQKVI